jgi:protein SFI1
MKPSHGRGSLVSTSQSSQNGRSRSKARAPNYYAPDDVWSDNESKMPPQAPHSQALFRQSSATDLYRDADAFEEMRFRNLQRRLLNHWRGQTKECAEQNRALELQAVAKDFLTLKRQALDFWRTACDQKRQQAREERFFEHLYKRAGQAYDLYLLTKSFTHWTQVTSSVASESRLARQRLLSIKYFRAWYQLTVTNELKAERQSLSASLNTLRRQAAQFYRDEVNALETYHENLTKYVFWRWFRDCCDRAAPRYREQQLQLRVFRRWRQKALNRETQMFQIESDLIRRSLQNVLRAWATKARIDVAGNHQADAFRRSQLLRQRLMHWHTEAKLRPATEMVYRMRDWKTARSKFSIWQLRTRMVFRADAVSRMRTLQNSFSAWNERLRSDALAARIDGRIVAEALYRWVIAQRYVLMQRMSEQHKKRNAMGTLLFGATERRDQLSSRAKDFVDTQERRKLRLTLDRWEDRASTIRACTQEALDVYDPKLKRDTLEAIRLKLSSMRQMETWAEEARFYFLVTRFLAVWRINSAETKRARERSAHAKMRRQYKVNLARHVLHTWSRQVQRDSEACWRGDDLYREKIRAVQRRLFGEWQQTASRRQQLVTQLSHGNDRRLMDHCLGLLVDASRHVDSLQSRAEKFHDLRMGEICSGQLRRFGMRAFEMRRRKQDADAMRDRRGIKHIRIMLQHWANKVQYPTYRDLGSDSPSHRPHQERESTDAGYGTASNEDHAPSTAGANQEELAGTHRAEEWPAFDRADLLDRPDWISPSANEESARLMSTSMAVPTAATPIIPAPGYLNTPSKRATRAKALAHLSTATTPYTPIRPAFATRLRELAHSAVDGTEER